MLMPMGSSCCYGALHVVPVTGRHLTALPRSQVHLGATSEFPQPSSLTGGAPHLRFRNINPSSPTPTHTNRATRGHSPPRNPTLPRLLPTQSTHLVGRGLSAAAPPARFQSSPQHTPQLAHHLPAQHGDGDAQDGWPQGDCGARRIGLCDGWLCAQGACSPSPHGRAPHTRRCSSAAPAPGPRLQVGTHALRPGRLGPLQLLPRGSAFSFLATRLTHLAIHAYCLPVVAGAVRPQRAAVQVRPRMQQTQARAAVAGSRMPWSRHTTALRAGKL